MSKVDGFNLRHVNHRLHEEVISEFKVKYFIFAHKKKLNT